MLFEFQTEGATGAAVMYNMRNIMGFLYIKVCKPYLAKVPR